MHSRIALALLIGSVLAVGCATEAGTHAEEPRDAPAYRTGSMLPKKDRSASDVKTVDPEAVRDALGGKPPGQSSGR